MKTYKWPLNINNFSFIDRLRIARFVLNKRNFWTHGQNVHLFEEAMRQYVGCNYAVFTSSGSTANTLLAMYYRDTIKNPKRNVVILPAVTWQTSCSPWIREGFTPHFIDIDLSTLSMDFNKLINYLDTHGTKHIACIFVTSLLGFNANIHALLEIEKQFHVKILLDNCENALGSVTIGDTTKHLSSYFTSTTSTYFGHHIQSIEGGFICTNSLNEYQYFLMARNHGMTRHLDEYCLNHTILACHSNQRNSQVDARFDFAMLGNNFRNTNLNAFIGMLDFKKRQYYIDQRISLYNYFKENIDPTKYFIIDPQYYHFNELQMYTHVPFSIPIIIKQQKSHTTPIQLIKNFCEKHGIETRPIISGNLLRHTAYKQYDSPTNFPNAEYLHRWGLYVGLYAGVNKKLLKKLITFLNTIAQTETKGNLITK